LNFTTSVPVTVKLDPSNVRFEFPKRPVPPDATVKTLASPVEPTIETELPPPLPATYDRLFHPVAPFPIFNLLVSVSNAGSPLANTVFAFDHSVEVPLRNCKTKFVPPVGPVVPTPPASKAGPTE
jgi:hypothetical protein